MPTNLGPPSGVPTVKISAQNLVGILHRSPLGVSLRSRHNDALGPPLDPIEVGLLSEAECVHLLDR